MLLAVVSLTIGSVACARTAEGDPNRFGTDQWYLPVETGSDGVVKARLFVHEYGRGAPVVVLHGGWGAEHSYMRPLLLPYATGTRRIVFYDQRGSLRSMCNGCDRTVSAHIADLEALRQALGQPRLTIVAHSMGTWLAQAYAQQYPDRVEKLILLGAMPALGDGLDDANRRAVAMSQRPEVLAQLAAAGIAPDANPERLPGRQYSDGWKIRFAGVNLFDPSLWRRLEGGRALYEQAVANGIGETMGNRWDFRPTLAQLPRPVDVIIGDHDYVDWGATRWTALAATPRSNVRLTVIPRAGHSGWFEQPDAFHRALEAALRR